MRNKRAKQLRRIARAASRQQPEQRYNRRLDQAGPPIRLDSNCTRRIYQWVKRQYKEARHG
jgi:hypothetical protein